jgi:hypothetical protein
METALNNECSSASFLLSLLAGDWLTTHMTELIPVQSSKLLLVLASTVVLCVGTHGHMFFFAEFYVF